jgi:hypothetical protein
MIKKVIKNSEEWKNIIKKFKKTMNNEIIKIERIQNKR